VFPLSDFSRRQLPAMAFWRTVGVILSRWRGLDNGLALFDEHADLSAAMAGHSRSKNGVASLACDPAIHVFLSGEGVDARHKAGHDG
jgi:hypothetical protein